MSSINGTSSTCPTNAIPENPDIDSNSIYAVVPRGNTTVTDNPDDWMISCCEPSTVQPASDNLTGSRWQWCDLPPRYTNWTSETSKMSDQFVSCVTSSTSYEDSTIRPNIFHVSAATRGGVMGDGMVVLGVVLVHTVWQSFT